MMKKINKVLAIVLIILLLVGCKEPKQKTKTITKEPIDNIIEPTIEEKTIDLGIYQNISGKRTLIEKLDIPFPKLQDIISLEIYYTKEKELIN